MGTTKKPPARKAAPRKAAPRKPAAPVAVEAPPPPPPPPATPPAKNNSLAIASIVCAAAGCSVVPVAGGVAATMLGALHIRRERQDPDRYTGRPLAVAALAIGAFAGLIPLLVVTFLAAKNITPIPFAIVVAYTAYVFVVATRGRTAGQRAAILGGSVLMTALAIAAAIGLGLLFYFGMRALLILIVTSIGHEIGRIFSEIVHSFKL